MAKRMTVVINFVSNPLKSVEYYYGQLFPKYVNSIDVSLSAVFSQLVDSKLQEAFTHRQDGITCNISSYYKFV
jgi:hypothetical protein